MSTMVERTEIPEHIWDAARSLRSAVLWESNSSVEHIAQALLAAEKRGKEEAAKIIEDELVAIYEDSPDIDIECNNLVRRVLAAIRGS